MDHDRHARRDSPERHSPSRRDVEHHRHRSPDREETDPPIPRVVSVGRSSSHSQAGAPTVAAPGQLVISAPTKGLFFPDMWRLSRCHAILPT